MVSTAEFISAADFTTHSEGPPSECKYEAPVFGEMKQSYHTDFNLNSSDEHVKC